MMFFEDRLCQFQIDIDNVKFEAYYKNQEQNFAGSAPIDIHRFLVFTQNLKRTPKYSTVLFYTVEFDL